MNALANMFTGKDNVSFDIGRALWAVVTLGYVVYAGWHVFVGHPFDPISYGTGAAAVLAGGGGALKLKQDTEPGMPPNATK